LTIAIILRAAAALGASIKTNVNFALSSTAGLLLFLVLIPLNAGADYLNLTGSNYFGPLGEETATASSTPVLVGTDVSQAAGGRSHSLFVKTDGTLWAMGGNINGQRDDGAQHTRSGGHQCFADCRGK
jgi:alpha-tubulin suppressor-like RCC1 family protein